MDSVVPYFANSCVALFIALDVRYDGPFQARRSVEGLSSITLKLLEFGYWDYFSDHHEDPAGRTIRSTTVRHALRNPIFGHTFPSSFSSFTMMPPTDRHRDDGPSQGRRTVTSFVGVKFSAFLAQKLPRSS